MHLSSYLAAWPSETDSRYQLLFSTKNGGITLLTKEAFAALAEVTMPEEWHWTLAEMGMLVLDPSAEREEVLQLDRRINLANRGLSIAVILGMGCNFRCRYCYEEGLKNGAAMTEKTARQLIDFVKKRYGGHKKKLTLDFYGGEPLLYTGRIKEIAGELKPFVEERGGRFLFTLVTNGSLLTRETVAELNDYGLGGVRITVDGPPKVHNAARPFSSGAPSFECILENIKTCCELTQIGIGGNFDRDNYPAFPGLLDIFEQEGLSPERLGRVQFASAMQAGQGTASPDFCAGCSSVGEPWVAEAALLLRKEVKRRGYRTPKISPSLCMVNMDDSLTIHYNGDLYKCPAIIGHRDYTIGSLNDGIEEYSGIYHLEQWKQEDECRTCLYLPLCFGGCRFMQHQRSGTMKGVDCWRDYYDRILPEFVELEVRHR